MRNHPGFRHHHVGDVRVTALLDGSLREDPAVLTGVPGGGASLPLGEGALPGIDIAVSAFLVQTGGILALVDAGCGTRMGPTAGLVGTSLREAGATPEDVDLVLLTHMHPDHVGGLVTAGGEAAYPRARILVSAADAALFLDPAAAAGAPPGAGLAFAAARAVADAYDGRFETFDGAAAVAPAIAAVPLAGHSPGHTGYRVASGGTSLLIWGDVVHVPAIQFDLPEVGMVFDADPVAARAARRSSMAEAARTGEAIAGMHLPFPAIGRVARAGRAYGFEPAYPPGSGREGAGA